jgi:hypothetical protein
MMKPGRRRLVLARLLPAIGVGLVIDGAGEMVGYAFGPGRAMAILTKMEFHRSRYLAPQDLKHEPAGEWREMSTE